MNNVVLEEYKGVYVFAQQVDNEISGIAFELLGKGKELAANLDTEVVAVLIGYQVKGLADKLAGRGNSSGGRRKAEDQRCHQAGELGKRCRAPYRGL